MKKRLALAVSAMLAIGMMTGCGSKAEPAATTAAATAAAETTAAESKAAKAPSLKSMKKDELIAFAKENGIEIDEKATKPVIIDAIEVALK